MALLGNKITQIYQEPDAALNPVLTLRTPRAAFGTSTRFRAALVFHTGLTGKPAAANRGMITLRAASRTIPA